MNPVQIARGIEKTAKALVSELKLMSREVNKIFSCFGFSKKSFLILAELNCNTFQMYAG